MKCETGFFKISSLTIFICAVYANLKLIVAYIFSRGQRFLLAPFEQCSLVRNIKPDGELFVESLKTSGVSFDSSFSADYKITWK